jgi:triacylglycerol lipase
VRGLLAEAVYTTDAAMRWLRGFAPEHVRVPSTRTLRSTRMQSTPVLLVHGLGGNKSYFVRLERYLARAGYTVYSVNYPWVYADLATCGQHVADDADRLLEETGADHMHVVAHSLGGVVLRWALTHTAMRGTVDVAVTLGSPHQGAPGAAWLPAALPALGHLVAELRPGSRALTGLADPADAPATRFVAVAGGLDWVIPGDRALLPERPNVRNVVIDDAAHISIAAHRDVLDVVLSSLQSVEEPPVAA